MTQHDLFISHAWEDKDGFVRPLAERLRTLGIDVWYDEYALSMGDSLSASIDKGLRNSRFGAVILSPSFFKKPWPEYEFRSLVALESGREKRILPIWYNVTRDDVLSYSPNLADKLAYVATGVDPLDVAIEVMRVAAPEKYSELVRAIEARRRAEENVTKVDIKDLTLGHLREPLDQTQLRRIRLIHEALIEVFPCTWEEISGNFQRDSLAGRDKEIMIWENIAGTFLSVRRQFPLSPEEAKQLFGHLLLSSMQGPVPLEPDSPEWLRVASGEFLNRLKNARE
ncbi:toll/interleukin-1 receptor domain-containing protein [Streptomyces sp. MMG1533]|uniref:toll/interleukin-1 receptor domain-containing protein n=1 Tax=Streptomyces sp. MMG1533 TaxID=1415546 RepID=UPI0006AFD4D4|nr:toll/interleukin-1 receptor domain-containing protein [Streptomyces sp. MMG1533]